MDRRTFIKSVGAMALLDATNTSGALQSDDQYSKYKNGKWFPEVRLIVVGSGGWQFLEDHYFRASTDQSLGFAADQILFIGRTGRAFKGPRPEDQDPLSWDFSIEGEECERDLDRIDDFRKYFDKTRPEIAGFIQPSDWVVLIASLDNGMAFVACDAIGQMFRDVGARIIGLVAAPYPESIENPIHRVRLENASDMIVNRMVNGGHPIILDRGCWAGQPMEWSWYYQDQALEVIHQTFQSQHSGVFAEMVACSSRLNCALGFGDTAVEAIQEAVDFDWEWTTRLDGRLRTAAGAVIFVSGNPKVLENLRAEVFAVLQQPDQFRRDGHPYWRNDAKFIVLAAPNQWSDKETYCIKVLSTGFEIA